MEWRTMDAMATDFHPGRFDCVIDKSLIDAVLTDRNKHGLANGVANVQRSGASSVKRVVAEMHRVIRVGGVYIVMSLHAWGDIRSYFQCSDTVKFACAHTSVTKAGTISESNIGANTVCLVICKKLSLTSTRESEMAASTELAAILHALAGAGREEIRL
jgi:hypothetical protein